jgi:hypothetical protein
MVEDICLHVDIICSLTAILKSDQQPTNQHLSILLIVFFSSGHQSMSNGLPVFHAKKVELQANAPESSRYAHIC